MTSCYYPDESPGNGLFPCNATAPVSHCCRTGDVCITNGYCFSAGLNALVRRGCTDKNFNSTECPRECIDGDSRSTDEILIPCESYGSFCCGQDEAARQCCTNGNGTVRIPAGSAIQSATASLTVSKTVSGATAFATTTVIQTPTGLAGYSAAKYDTQKKITIGVGAGLAAVLLLVGAFLAWKWLRARKQIDEMTKADVQLRNRG